MCKKIFMAIKYFAIMFANFLPLLTEANDNICCDCFILRFFESKIFLRICCLILTDCWIWNFIHLGLSIWVLYLPICEQEKCGRFSVNSAKSEGCFWPLIRTIRKKDSSRRLVWFSFVLSHTPAFIHPFQSPSIQGCSRPIFSWFLPSQLFSTQIHESSTNI